MHSTDVNIFFITYGGPFQDAMNDLYSPAKIQETAARVRQLEQEYGPFQVGKFNRYLMAKSKVPKNFSFSKFEKDFATIPSHLRQRVSDVLRANFHSNQPLPVYCKVSENLDQTSDVIIRPIVYNNQLYIGVLYLCPNTQSPP